MGLGVFLCALFFTVLLGAQVGEVAANPSRIATRQPKARSQQPVPQSQSAASSASNGLFDMTLPQNPAIYTHNTPFNALMGGQADPATFVQGTPQEGTSFSGPRCSGSTTPASSILSEEETLGMLHAMLSNSLDFTPDEIQAACLRQGYASSTTSRGNSMPPVDLHITVAAASLSITDPHTTSDLESPERTHEHPKLILNTSPSHVPAAKDRKTRARARNVANQEPQETASEQDAADAPELHSPVPEQGPSSTAMSSRLRKGKYRASDESLRTLVDDETPIRTRKTRVKRESSQKYDEEPEMKTERASRAFSTEHDGFRRCPLCDEMIDQCPIVDAIVHEGQVYQVVDEEKIQGKHPKKQYVLGKILKNVGACETAQHYVDHHQESGHVHCSCRRSAGYVCLYCVPSGYATEQPCQAHAPKQARGPLENQKSKKGDDRYSKGIGARKSNLEQHSLTHCNGKHFRCVLCGTLCTTQGNFIKHHTDHHSDETREPYELVFAGEHEAQRQAQRKKSPAVGKRKSQSTKNESLGPLRRTRRKMGPISDDEEDDQGLEVDEETEPVRAKPKRRGIRNLRKFAEEDQMEVKQEDGHDLFAGQDFPCDDFGPVVYPGDHSLLPSIPISEVYPQFMGNTPPHSAAPTPDLSSYTSNDLLRELLSRGGASFESPGSSSANYAYGEATQEFGSYARHDAETLEGGHTRSQDFLAQILAQVSEGHADRQVAPTFRDHWTMGSTHYSILSQGHGLGRADQQMHEQHLENLEHHREPVQQVSNVLDIPNIQPTPSSSNARYQDGPRRTQTQAAPLVTSLPERQRRVLAGALALGLGLASHGMGTR